MQTSLEASIVDQQVQGIVAAFPGRLGKGREKTDAFTVLCLKTYLQLDDDDALDCITDGHGDASIDAVHIHIIDDSEIAVTLVQSKYGGPEHVDEEFPLNDIVKLSSYIQTIFVKEIDPSVNPRLRTKLAEIKSLVSDGAVVNHRILCCNIGRRWGNPAQQIIDQWGSRLSWIHVNHEYIVKILESQKNIAEGTIRFAGRAVFETHEFIQIMLGKVQISQIKALFDQHGDSLLERNVRRHLGLNRVNSEIKQTLVNPDSRGRFYFYNNGVTAICENFVLQDMRDSDPSIRFKGLQIINGGQTCKTIQQTLSEHPQEDFSQVHVLLRLYAVGAVADSHQELISNITQATNSQSPVDLGDLRANDKRQRLLGLSLKQLGYTYRTKRGGPLGGQTTISSTVAAEAVLAIWRCKPNAAKFRNNRLFSTEFYSEIFSRDLNGAHVAYAVQIFRHVENERRKHDDRAPDALRFIPYASHFVAMIMGWKGLRAAGLELEDLNHKTFDQARNYFDQHRDSLYQNSVEELQSALEKIQVTDQITLPRLAAVFRRGDLLGQILLAMNLPYQGGFPPLAETSDETASDIVVTVTKSGILSTFLPGERWGEENTVPKGDYIVAVMGLAIDESIIIFCSDGIAATVRAADLPRIGTKRGLTEIAGTAKSASVVGAISTDARFVPEFAQETMPDLGDEYEEPYPHMLAVSTDGAAVRFCLWPYRTASRKGGRAYMRVREGASVVRVMQVYADDEVVVITKDAYCLRREAMDIPLVKRAGRGKKIMSATENSGKVAGLWSVTEDPSVMLLSKGSVMMKGNAARDIPITTGSSRVGTAQKIHVRNKISHVRYPSPGDPDFEAGEVRLRELGYI